LSSAKNASSATGPQPNNKSDLPRNRNKAHAILFNCNAVLALCGVVRVKDRLKRLDKWPKAIEAY